MIEVPATFSDWIVQSKGEAGVVWLAQLSDQFERLLARWNLEPDGEPRHGGKALALPVRSSAGPAVLKVTWVNELTREEAAVLRYWDGHGVVRLLWSDLAEGALLLERLDPDRTLTGRPNDEAARVAGLLIRLTAIPALPALTTVASAIDQIRTMMESHWARLGRPYPRRELDRVLALTNELPRSTDLRMVNWDLWDGNVLGSKRPEGGWLAIDPWALAGDPESGVAQLLWRRVDGMKDRADLERFIANISETAGLDHGLVKAWSYVRVADYWLWALDHGLTEDPARCKRLLGWLV